MLTFQHNIPAVIEQLRGIPAALAAGRAAALDVAHWKSRAIDTARVTLQAIAQTHEHPSIPIFMAAITLSATSEGFVIRLDPTYDPKEEAGRLDVRQMANLPIFMSAFAKSQEEAWYIIRDWVEFAKDIKEQDMDADGVVDYDDVASRIHYILFRPTSPKMVEARDRLLRSGKRGGGQYLLDFAAGMHSAGAYGLGQASARAWLQAVGTAWTEMVRTELPRVMVAHLDAALRRKA